MAAPRRLAGAVPKPLWQTALPRGSPRLAGGAPTCLKHLLSSGTRGCLAICEGDSGNGGAACSAVPGRNRRPFHPRQADGSGSGPEGGCHLPRFLTQTKGRRVPGRADRGLIKAPGPPASPHGRARDPPAAGLRFYLCKKIITRVVTEQKKVPFSVVKLVSQSDKARKCGLILSGECVCTRVWLIQ